MTGGTPKTLSQLAMAKVKLLRSGSRVGIIAPSALFNQKEFHSSVKALEKMGLEPVFNKAVFKKDFIYSGTAQERVKDFYQMLNRSDIEALWCTRGGYGSWEVAEVMTKRAKPKTPKLLIGMSDISAMQSVILHQWGWPVLYGPLFSRLGSKEVKAKERQVLKNSLFDPSFRLSLKGLKNIGPSKVAKGDLVGGNLSMLASSIGTPWEVQTRGKILFIEEIGERAYRLDRMFYQLRAAGKFKGLKGLVFGDFNHCLDKGKQLWPQVLKRNFSDMPFPVLSGIKMGHGPVQLALPMGVKVRVSGKKGTLEVLESYGR